MKIKPLTYISPTDEFYVRNESERRLERRKQEQENTNKQYRTINFEDACWGILASIFNQLCSQFSNLPGRKLRGALVLQTKSGENVLLCLFL